uniref:Uncharacterized protein n=1 Tax=viral metagenome TaxID=1070528 RepID=A0A2V0R9H3_9ZZZZ
MSGGAELMRTQGAKRGFGQLCKLLVAMAGAGEEDPLGLYKLEWSEGWLQGGVQEKRRRLRATWGKRVGWKFCTHAVLNDVLAGYMLALPKGLRGEFLALSGRVGLHEADPTTVLRTCRCVAVHAFKYGYTLFGSLWRYLVDLDMLFGSSTQGATREEAKEELRDWVNRETKWSGEKFESMIATGFPIVEGKLRAAASAYTKERRGAAEFAQRPSEWVSPGASTVDGLVGVRSNKISTWMKYAARIRSYLETGEQRWSDRANLWRNLEKRERKKVRQTVKASFTSFVDQSFCLQGVEDIVGAGLRTSLGSDPEKLWEGLQKDVNKHYPVPIDIPAFDHRPPAWLVLKCVRLLLELCSDGSPEMEASARRVLHQIQTGKLTDGVDTWDWEGGVMSGWRVTTVLDTVINACLAYGTRTPQAADPATTGDDALFFVRTKGQARELVSEYMEAVGVNERKFFCDGVRGEFLRYLLVKGARGRAGYPARAFSGYVFTQAFSGGGAITADEIIGDMEMLVQRGLCPVELGRQAVLRLADHFGVSNFRAWEFLHTPASAGGGGVYPWAGNWWAVKRDVDLVVISGTKFRRRPWDDIPGETKNGVYRTASALGLHADHLRGVAEGLVFKKKVDGDVGAREYLHRVQRVNEGMWLEALGLERTRRPRFTIDGWFASSWIRFRPDRWCEVVEDSDLTRLKALESRIGRGRFLDWLQGESCPVSVRGSFFGSLDIADVMQYLRNWIPKFSSRVGGNHWMGRIVATESRILNNVVGRWLA